MGQALVQGMYLAFKLPEHHSIPSFGPVSRKTNLKAAGDETKVECAPRRSRTSGMRKDVEPRAYQCHGMDLNESQQNSKVISCRGHVDAPVRSFGSLLEVSLAGNHDGSAATGATMLVCKIRTVIDAVLSTHVHLTLAWEGYLRLQ